MLCVKRFARSFICTASEQPRWTKLLKKLYGSSAEVRQPERAAKRNVDLASWESCFTNCLSQIAHSGSARERPAATRCRLSFWSLPMRSGKKLKRLRTRCNVDAAVAAEALAEATHAVADGVARNGWRDRKGEEIKDVGNYLFQTYGNRIVFIAGQAGLFRTDHMDMMDYFAELQAVGQGAPLERGRKRDFLPGIDRRHAAKRKKCCHLALHERIHLAGDCRGARNHSQCRAESAERRI